MWAGQIQQFRPYIKKSMPAGGGGVLALAFRFSFEQAPQVPTFNQEAFRAFFKDVI